MSENTPKSPSDFAHARSKNENTSSRCESAKIDDYVRLLDGTHCIPYESIARFLLSVSACRPLLRELFPTVFEHDPLITSLCSSLPSADDMQHRITAYDDPSAPLQRRIVNTLGSFFQTEFRDVYKQYGIVYTPLEIVDFILHSVNDVLQKEFGRSLSDDDVDILDPFLGSGTFLARLYELGLARPRVGIHGNEIDLFSYFVSLWNLRAVTGEFSHDIYLGDTFSSSIAPSENIRVIIGNPPYSTGRKSTGALSPEEKYPYITRRVFETYVKDCTVKNKCMHSDSYVRCMRYASDLLTSNPRGGIIGFVVNGSWVRSRSASGMRKHFAKDFSSIYIFNLRGNGRKHGEARRADGGHIFPGVRVAPVIVLFVRRPDWDSDCGPAKIFYHEIGDYLSRDAKYAKIRAYASVLSPDMTWDELHPGVDGWWLTTPDPVYGSYTPIFDPSDSGLPAVFAHHYPGVQSAGDGLWWSFSRAALETNVRRAISDYDACLAALFKEPHRPAEDIIADVGMGLYPWNRDKIAALSRRRIHPPFDAKNIRAGMLRPFVREYLYSDPFCMSRATIVSTVFPDPSVRNRAISVTNDAIDTFSCFMVDMIPNGAVMTSGQFLPLIAYSPDGERHDGISDEFLWVAREKYRNPLITKEDIFYYVYGLLHSREYRTRYAHEFVRAIPRIPLVSSEDDFLMYIQAGRDLADLHTGYETVEPYSGVTVEISDPDELGNITRISYLLRFQTDPETGKRTRVADRSIVRFFTPKHKTRPIAVVSGIPARAHEYLTKSHSGPDEIVYWCSARYVKRFGLFTCPSAWGNEHGNPRYILDLLLRVITVSMKTMDIIDSLPRFTGE